MSGSGILRANPVFQGEADGMTHVFTSKKGPLYLQVDGEYFRWSASGGKPAQVQMRLSVKAKIQVAVGKV